MKNHLKFNEYPVIYFIIYYNDAYIYEYHRRINAEKQ